MKTVLTLMALLCTSGLIAQDTSKNESSSVIFSGYAEAYYSYDFNKPADNNRPGFIYSHNRHNEFNLNIGFIKGAYNTEKVRANLALAAGTYINANYVAEQGVLKNIYEANAGYRIGRNKNLWVDAGIFASHIGFENAISKDCWTLTRSILAENSPYYEAGLKLTYTSDNGKVLLSAMALNGWQRIKRVDGNSMMSWGTQVQFKPSEKVLLNYSTFLGTDKPDSARLIRIFHNLYGIFTLRNKIGVTLGFDFGTEEKPLSANGVYTWYSPVAIVKYSFNDSWAIAGRYEYYDDKNGVIIPVNSPGGFKTAGYSVNIDYVPQKNVLMRIEARTLNSKDDIFVKQEQPVKSNSFLTGSIAISF